MVYILPYYNNSKLDVLSNLEQLDEREQRRQFHKEAKQSGETFKKRILDSIMSLEREGYGE
jgi:hypothetical protein